MPIVFVHGVNNRDGEAYRENEQARDAFLKEIVAPTLGVASRTIIWSLVKQVRVGLVPIFHGLHRRTALER